MIQSRKKWWLIGGGVIAAAALAIPVAYRSFVSYRPPFYNALVAIPQGVRQRESRRFLNESLRLRNDLANEAAWDVAFTDEEVNAWLAEDLVAQFADQLPPGVHDPRILFEPDRATIAFEMRSGAFPSVVWAVLQVSVPEPNVLGLVVERIRAGAVPIPAERALGPLIAHARKQGLQVDWDPRTNPAEVRIHYQADIGRRDIHLENIRLANGSIRLSGSSEPQAGVKTYLELPRGKALQSRFPSPSRTVHPVAAAASRPAS